VGTIPCRTFGVVLQHPDGVIQRLLHAINLLRVVEWWRVVALRVIGYPREVTR